MDLSSKKEPASFLGNPICSQELFADLESSMLSEIEAMKRAISVPAGEYAVTRGDLLSNLHILAKGDARLIIHLNSGNAVTRRIAAKEMFGMPEIFGEGRSAISILASSRCEFDLLPVARFSKLLQLETDLSFRIVKVLGANLTTGRQVLGSTTV